MNAHTAALIDEATRILLKSNDAASLAEAARDKSQESILFGEYAEQKRAALRHSELLAGNDLK